MSSRLALILLGLFALVATAAGTAPTAAADPLGHAPGSPVATGRGPTAIATGDFNGDGRTDLAVVNSGDATLTILLGGETGRFRRAAGNPVTVGSGPQRAVVADFNRDGRDDLAVTNRASGDVSVLLGDGRGRFRRSARLTTAIPTASGFGSPVAIGARNLDSDRIPDLAVTVLGADGHGAVETFLGTGDGGFGPAQLTDDPDAGAGSAQALAIADLDEDGHRDIVLARGSPDSNRVETLLGDGAGAFSSGPSAAVGRSPDALVVTDVNGDGHQDVAVTNKGDGTVSVLLGNGHGRLSPAGAPVPAGVTPTGIVAGDFDGDRRVDLAVANADAGTVTVLRGNGRGGFTRAPALRVGGAPQALAPGDFDGDGTFDLAVGNFAGSTLTVLVHYRPREITLTRSRHGFAGTFSSGEAYCERHQRVTVIRSRPGPAVTVGRTRTDGLGRFTLAARAKRGRYTATVPRTPGCRAAASRALTLR